MKWNFDFTLKIRRMLVAVLLSVAFIMMVFGLITRATEHNPRVDIDNIDLEVDMTLYEPIKQSLCICD